MKFINIKYIIIKYINIKYINIKYVNIKYVNIKYISMDYINAFVYESLNAYSIITVPSVFSSTLFEFFRISSSFHVRKINLINCH